MPKGIDISHNATVTDWSAVKAGGIDFVMIRSGYGQLNDKKFTEHMKGAASVGLPIGIWYFAYALSVGQAALEAEHCVKLINPYDVDLPVFYDFEYDTETYAAKKRVTYDVGLRTAIHKAFCERVKALGYTPGIYTNSDYITSRLNWDELKDYKLWLAQWPFGGDKTIDFTDVGESDVSKKWGAPMIWQIGKGTVSGSKYDTDLNYGYMALPVKATTPVPVPDVIFKVGDKVALLNTYVSGGAKRARLYDSLASFVVYYDSYDVLGVSGKRAVIGKAGKITAAVHCDNLKKL